MVLRWEGGWWAHKYDVHFGTTNPPPLVAQDYMPGRPPPASARPRVLQPLCTAFAVRLGLSLRTRARDDLLLDDSQQDHVRDARRITGPVWSFTTTGGAPPPVSTGTQRVVADAYVRGGQYAGTNFGGAPDLVAKFSADPALRRETFLKLDISGVQSGQTVRLRLFGRLSDTREPSVIVGIYPASSIAWGETTITWNNRPTPGPSQWNVVTVAGTTSRWYEVDLTPQVQFERSLGRTTIALVLRKTLETLPYVTFGSRNSSNPPSLVVQ